MIERTMQITCSNCCKHQKINYSSSGIFQILKEGWGSYGSALYCPECTRTWHERNDKSMADSDNTLANIINLYHKEKY